MQLGKIVLSLATIFLGGNCIAEDKIRVIDADTAKGIKAYIDKIDKNYTKQRVSATGQDGYLVKEFSCEILEKIIVTPINHRAYYYDSYDCPIKKKIISLKSNKRQRNLVKNAQSSFHKGDFGTAALAYTEAAFRLSSTNQSRQEYIELEVKAYDSIAHYLSIEESTVFDTKQNKPVMSQKLKKAILDFQVQKGLKTTGELDFQTLSTVSSKTLSEVLFYSPPDQK
ncbi:peptidoglycan-binding domain-containing protein [Vibrio hepatarius]|uniref:peptidoglycan-binding domain-containing protein n=1 Tax=Vibrio hepatarius TaxID=171383 RepID=UPI001C0821C3|nr:peptidoglycan-binding domain-containing protein [Vibrio hepatarius]MBU2895805.1 peptidoglycan-binding protein [Vibrio hepatarius]